MLPWGSKKSSKPKKKNQKQPSSESDSDHDDLSESDDQATRTTASSSSSSKSKKGSSNPPSSWALPALGSPFVVSSRDSGKKGKSKSNPLSDLIASITTQVTALFDSRSTGKKGRKGAGGGLVTNIKNIVTSLSPKSTQSWGILLFMVFFILYSIDFYQLSAQSTITRMHENPKGGANLDAVVSQHPLMTQHEKPRNWFSPPGGAQAPSQTQAPATAPAPGPAQAPTTAPAPAPAQAPASPTDQSLPAATTTESPSGELQPTQGDAVQQSPPPPQHQQNAPTQPDSSAATGPTIDNPFNIQFHTDPRLHPMTRNVAHLMVPPNTGKLSQDDIAMYYRKLAKSYLIPFEGGIPRETIFEILKRRTYGLTPPGANKGTQSMLVQIIDNKIFLMDPYEVPKTSKAFYRSRINEMIWLLTKITQKKKIRNTEFLVSIHDCVQTASAPHNYRAARFVESKPAFTIVACNFSDNIPFPMWEGDIERGGGYSSWEAKMKEYSVDDIAWTAKQEKAVFRGGIRLSCIFENKTVGKMFCDTAGRSKLIKVAEANPDSFDVSVAGSCKGIVYKLSRLEPREHHRYKYIIYSEGNCFWADRLNIQIFGPSAILKQETPCGQFFEPLLRPGVHYMPVDFYFDDAPQKVAWAKANDDKVREMIKNVNEFAWNFLSLDGIMTYVEVLLDEYTNLLPYANDLVKEEAGAVEVTGQRL